MVKAIRKSDGKQIEVTPAFGGYYESDGELYSKADLDILPEKETAVLEGWVARDDSKQLWLFDCKEKPYRVSLVSEEDPPTTWGPILSKRPLPTSMFPSVTWQSEPKRVRIRIEEITAIAREYAEEYYDARGGKELMTGEAENMIRFILRRYCLVDKSKLKEFDIPRRVKEHNALILDKCELDALFPEIAKDEEIAEQNK